MSEALTEIKSTVNCELIKQSQRDPDKKCSVLKDLQDDSKKKSVAFWVPEPKE